MVEGTRKKVQQVIEDAHHSTNMGALILAHKNSQMIGVILNYTERDNENVLQDPFEGMIIGTLEKEIRVNNYFMMFYVSEKAEEVLRLAQSWKIDGLVIIGLQAEGSKELKNRTDTPIVFIDSYFNDDKTTYHNVGLNDYSGGRKMTEYLIQSGHRHILFLADNVTPTGVDLMRLKGFQAVREEQGIPWKDEYFFPISRNQSERHLQYQHILENLETWTALFLHPTIMPLMP
ncbi:LacI family DNA-binding transcriptional regulator [Sediminispirochaeta bajacaliforniensis]|uniref:LacI family DNA-binding transcriptional regulator n=1 Tax=Sediminispirochaeta bajacaliforniensis TaxID=148 RepID=UPI000380610A|nr:LacI family DNA-binding transcriptional regulator [Sediminispirochaeta bajacaliforniensis]